MLETELFVLVNFEIRCCKTASTPLSGKSVPSSSLLCIKTCYFQERNYETTSSCYFVKINLAKLLFRNEVVIFRLKALEVGIRNFYR
jgi:hypothetical protein